MQSLTSLALLSIGFAVLSHQMLGPFTFRFHSVMETLAALLELSYGRASLNRMESEDYFWLQLVRRPAAGPACLPLSPPPS